MCECLFLESFYTILRNSIYLFEKHQVHVFSETHYVTAVFNHETIVTELFLILYYMYIVNIVTLKQGNMPPDV